MATKTNRKALAKTPPPVTIDVPTATEVAAQLAGDYAALVNDVQARVQLVATMPLQNEGDRAGIVNELGRNKTMWREIDERRRKRKEPWALVAKSVDAYFMPLLDELALAEAETKTRVLDWQRAEQEKRDRQLREQREREQQAQARAELAKAKGLPAPNIIPREAPPVVERHTATAAGGGSTTVNKWKARIVNMDAVPREFCTPNLKLIEGRMRACLDATGSPGEIAGVEFFQDENLAIKAI